MFWATSDAFLFASGTFIGRVAFQLCTYVLSGEK